jgi:hypothetical protein
MKKALGFITSHSKKRKKKWKKMKTIKKYLPLALILGALGLGTAYNVSAEPRKTKDFIGEKEYYQLSHHQTTQKETSPSNGKYLDELLYYLPEGPSKEYQEKAGQRMIDLMQDECDYVNYYFMERQNGQRNLIVWCYKENDDKSWPEWGLNLDYVCRAYLETKKFMGIRVKTWLIAELADGSANSKTMSYNSAKELVNILEEYFQKYNQNNCTDWELNFGNNFTIK